MTLSGPGLRALVAGAALVAVTASAPAHATSGPNDDQGQRTYTLAVIGDVPYGAGQIAAFPYWIGEINADPDVRQVVHLGDIKNGSSVCSDDYFATIRSDFDTFEDPLVYTPGDNEWTDCHRANNGRYNPLERLATLRQDFFDRPDRALGQHPMHVDSQAAEGYPENVEYRTADVTFAAANVPGSDNGLQAWEGLGYTAPTSEQQAAVADRTRADIELLRQAFADATRRHDRAVVIEQQADMFDPTYTPTANDIKAFAPWIQAIIDESSRFDGPVYLLNGDSHAYNSDHPLATGSSWLTTYAPYGVHGSADNLTRITVDGSANNHDWLKVTIHDGGPQVLTWTRVPYVHAAS